MKEPHTMEASRATKEAYKRLQALNRKTDEEYYYEPEQPERTLWQSFTHFLYVREREIMAVSFGLMLSIIAIGVIAVGPTVLKHI